MRKQYVSLLIIILSISAIFSSCADKMSKKIGELQFENLKANETAYLFADTAKPSCNININFAFPVSSNDELLKDTLNYYFITACFGEKYALELPQEVLKKYVANYVNEYRTDLEPLYLQDEKDIQDGSTIDSWYSYYKNIEGEVQFYDKGLLVYRSYFDEYTGGAHGIYMSTFLNIDLAIMRPLKLDDIFVGDYKENITNMIWSELMAKHKVKTREALEDLGYGSTGEIAPTENFYLDNKGITFYYNVYDITPYAMGPVTVSLSYSMIDHWLNTNPVIQALKN